MDKSVARVFSQAILDKASHTPFDGLPLFKVRSMVIMSSIFKQVLMSTALENEGEGLIK